MNGVCVRAIGQFAYTPLPDPVPGAGELCIRVSVTGLCRTDLKIIEQGHRDLVLPRVPGEEVVGIVEAVGEGADAAWLNQRVYVYPGVCCGVCERCRGGAANLCREMRIMGFHRDGGFAERVVVPQSTVIPVPAGLSDEQAVFAEPLSCCLNALENARLARGERVCIFGGGPAGTLLARLALALGAGAVSVVEPDARRHRWHGGTLALQGHYDVAVPAVGDAEAYREALAQLAPRGRLVAFSGLSGALPPIDLNALHYLEQTLVGAYGCQYRHGVEALAMLADGRVPVEDLISHRLPLARLEEALQIVRTRGGMKVLLYP